ncbi:hypothetical protein DPMN_081330 [Dreissena polymorpha]|uniref:Uncharacterized protein n=1 Tax=Dreissena polymorpha TaxID=45954 RepID=A0A9D4B943_DREPO|nr:hypothetical protein DPMN_081330 [Dreissena polymorpha]
MEKRRSPDSEAKKGPVYIKGQNDRYSTLDQANQLLKDLTTSTTFIRFIEYRKVANLLTANGLHLSPAGAKNCLECILKDVLQHAEVKESASLEADPLSDPWPSLGTANTDDASLTKTFEAVVHEAMTPSTLLVLIHIDWPCASSTTLVETGYLGP